MVTIENLAAELVTMRNEMNAMQTSIILTQGLIGTRQQRSDEGEEQQGQEQRQGQNNKEIGFKIKDAQHLIPNTWT